VTPQNRDLNAREALQWSDRFLLAADQLAAAGLHDRATSQLYYAVFHAVRALLFGLGIEPRSHRALRSLFRQHFVKTGDFQAEDAVFLDQLGQEREDADYVVSHEVAADEYTSWRTTAAALLDRIRTHLAAGAH
jgi:uncharacterized protein (UPF0332 family)